MKNQYALFICCLISATALANEHGYDTNDLFELDLAELIQINVTSASLFDEHTIQAAANIESIHESNWLTWGARRNSDVISQFASVEAYPTFFGGHAYAVRGYSQVLSVRGMSTLIDGVPVNDIIFGTAQYNSEHISLGVVDSIELIKGPGSTLYGSDAFHGSLQFNTFYAEESVLKLHGQLGAPDYQQANIKWSHQITGEHFINASVDYRKQNTWQWDYYNLAQQQNDTRDYQYDVNTINIKLHNKRENDLYYQIGYHNNAMQGKGFVGGGALFGYQLDDQSTADQSLAMWNAQLSYKLNAHHTVGTKYYDWRNERNNDFAISSGIANQQHQVDKWALQAYWQYQHDSNRLYIGAEKSEQTVVESSISLSSALAKSQNSRTPELEQGYVREVDSLFAQGRWQTPFKPLEIELGIRLDDYQEFGEQKTPRLAAIFSLDDTKTLRFIYSEAFRAAVTLELFGSTAIQGSPDIKPEELISHEIIWNHQINNHLAYQLNIFRNDWEQGIVGVAIDHPVFSSQFVNSGSNSSQGVEASIKYKRDNWLVTAQTSYIKSKNDVMNTDFVMFPRWSAMLELVYKVNSDLSVHSRAWFKDNWQANIQPDSAELAAYKKLDIALEYAIADSVNLSLAVKNITDEENIIPSILASEQGELEPNPRQVELSINWQF